MLGLEQTQVAVRAPFLDNSVVKAVYRGPGPVAVNEEGRLRLIREGNPSFPVCPLIVASAAAETVLSVTGFWSSYLRLNTLTTTVCRNGLPGLTTFLGRFISSDSGSVAIRSSTFGFGIAMSWPPMFARCCWINGRWPAHTWRLTWYELLSTAILKVTTITLLKFIGLSLWS